MSDNPVLAAIIELRKDFGALGSDLFQVEGAVTGLRADVAAGQARLEGRLVRLQAGQNNLRGDVMERMDRFQHALDLVKDDIVVNFGASDHVERIAKGASEETRAPGEVVRATQRQIAWLRTDLDDLRKDGAA